MQAFDLLRRCAENVSVEQLGAMDLRRLEQWNVRVRRRSLQLSERFLATPLTDWEKLITEHEAHRHSWYDFFSDDITIDEAAKFLLENRYYPSFLRLLQRIVRVQKCAGAVSAIAENIADEY